MNVKKEVTKQALCEYLAARYCAHITDHSGYPEPHLIERGVRSYVESRYASQNEVFKKAKVMWLIPRIEAAYSVLADINFQEE